MKVTWEDKNKQLQFFQELAKKFQIKDPKDWHKVTVSQVHREGGSFIKRFYGGSLLQALKGVYPGFHCKSKLLNFVDIKWQKSWFPRIPKHNAGFFDSQTNCKKFLNQFMREFKIEKPVDWMRVTKSVIKRSGGMVQITCHLTTI